MAENNNNNMRLKTGRSILTSNTAKSKSSAQNQRAALQIRNGLIDAVVHLRAGPINLGLLGLHLVPRRLPLLLLRETTDFPHLLRRWRERRLSRESSALP